MIIITLDLEGVLVPEIWQAVAQNTGIIELNRTTRDEPDYDKLMNYRLNILREHKLKYSDIYKVINQVEPLTGAVDFVARLRAKFQLIILSDTFAEFAEPLMIKLNKPTLFCHNLIINNDEIIGYKLRQSNQKAHAVRALQSLNFEVLAAGDSYNDVGMLTAANKGFFFHSPENIRREYPQFLAFEKYDDLFNAINSYIA